MENNKLISRNTKIAVLLVRIAVIFGLSVIMFEPKIYNNSVTPLFISAYALSLPVGILVAYVLGIIIRFFFKSFIKNKFIYFLFLIISIIAGYGTGFFSSMFIWKILAGSL